MRLKQGKASDSTVYSQDPVAMACHWVGQGAQRLHVVDLDGAFTGKPKHTDVIARIVSAIPIPVEVGGGVRTDEDLAALFDAGVAYAIIGTRAIEDPAVLKKLVDKWGDRIIVGIDARDGYVQINGWVETTRLRALDLAKIVSEVGVETIIYTDTATDGMLAGPNIAAMDAMCGTVDCQIIASGGVSSAANVRQLIDLKRHNLFGAIVGRALYEDLCTLPELIEATK